VLRFQVSSVPSKPEVIPLPNLLRVSEPTETWHSSRIFFATADGHTRLVDFEQTIYDVDVAEDDGGSDFDSIASPAKYSPAKFDPRLSLLCDDTEATSSSDNIETEFDVEDLAELRRFDSTAGTQLAIQAQQLTLLTATSALMISIQGTYSSYNIHNSDISIDMSSSLQSSSANSAIVKSKVSQR
jgi:hypothetical protein